MSNQVRQSNTLSEAVGHRVREKRKAASLTRKALCAASGMSERYLAELEGGRANVSLNMLAALAQCLEVSLHDLIPASPAAAAGQRSIALIGLRGAGKSTLGAALAATLGLPFLRLSQAIAERAGMDMGELMALGGMHAYRKTEYEALAELAGSGVPMVLETSGGIVDEHATFEFLLARFRTIWIRARPEEHMARVLAQNDLRPMAGRAEAMAELKALLARREPAYARAHAVLETSGESPEMSAEALVNLAGRTSASPSTVTPA